MRAIAKISVLTFVLLSVAADAAETITYTYDARGRLVNVMVLQSPVLRAERGSIPPGRSGRV